MATKFRFSKPYTYEVRSPKGALLQSIEYPAGEADVLEAHAKAAEEAGAGQRVVAAEPAAADDGKKSAKGK